MSDRTVGLRDSRQLANLLNCVFVPRDDEISTVNPPPVEANLNTHSSGLDFAASSVSFSWNPG